MSRDIGDMALFDLAVGKLLQSITYWKCYIFEHQPIALMHHEQYILQSSRATVLNNVICLEVRNTRVRHYL